MYRLRYQGKWSLDEKQTASLRLFLNRVDECGKYGSFRYPVEAKIRVENGVLSSEAELPNEHVLRSASMAARHFYMKQSPTNFHKICNVLYQSTIEDCFRTEIADIRRRYGALLAKEVSPTTSIKWLNTQDDLVNAFFNGVYFHSDEEQMQFVSDESNGFAALFKRTFAQTVYSMISCATNLALVTKNALGIDLLACCPTSERVQAVLSKHGMKPVAIDILESSDGRHNPPRPFKRCRLDITLPKKLVAQVARDILEIMFEEWPDYTMHQVDYNDENGTYSMLSAERIDSNNGEPE